MLNAHSHTVTRVADGGALTLVFYPDTGCLRIADALGVCHEMRPPHSWLAISAASRGVRRGTQALAETLSVLLHDFCSKRPRWLNGPARMSAQTALDALCNTVAPASRAPALHAPLAEPFTGAIASVR
jgi:hypothetical protein